MPQPPDQTGPSAKHVLAGVGAAGLAIGCCAGLPLLAAFAGGVGIATVLGAGAVVIAAIAAIATAILGVHARRRRACQTPAHPERQTRIDPSNAMNGNHDAARAHRELHRT